MRCRSSKTGAAMTYYRSISGEEVSLPERDLNPPEQREFTDDELQVARDEIIECALLFSSYPRPSDGRLGSKHVRMEFDLHEFLLERIGHGEAIEFVALALSDYGICGAFADRRNEWEKKVTEWLLAYFTDTERGQRIVEARAEEIERDKAEDQ